MNWSSLVEALMLITGGLVLLGVWYGGRLRDRLATEALKASEERFRHLTLLSADWFWETDAEYRLNWMSGGPAMSELFTGGPAYGKRLWEVEGIQVEPRRLIAHLDRLLHIDAQLPLFDFEVSGKGPDGRRRVHAVTGRARYDASGKFLGYRGVGTEITGKRRAERALAESKERLELATEGGNVAVWDIDIGTDQIHLGNGWAQLLGGRDPGPVQKRSEERRVGKECRR